MKQSIWHIIVFNLFLSVAVTVHAMDAPQDGSQQKLLFGSKTLPFVQPGCHVMFRPGGWCLPTPSPHVRGCCTPGHVCLSDTSAITGHSCQPMDAKSLSYSFDEARLGNCSARVSVGGQCGGAGFDCYKYGTCDQFGPWQGFCCPNGYSCQPYSTQFRRWQCLVDVQDQAPVDTAKEILAYPPRAMPRDACTCRHGWDKERIPMECPSPWASLAGTSKVPPPLRIEPGGKLVDANSGKPAVLHGVNWFGWHVGSYNFDGLWAFCDDNTTYSDPPCAQDGDIPPYGNPSASQWSPAVGEAGQRALNMSYWGKRRMTNDFAAVVYRMRLLGFNAVRVQFNFAALNTELPPAASDFFPCLHDSDEYIGIEKTLDPLLAKGLGSNYGLEKLAPYLPRYTGMPHPPPRNSDARCAGPWSAPFLSTYTGGRGPSLNLTMCNWYLPQGPGVLALYRFLWQLQYLVSQGMYVLLDFSSTRPGEPNVVDPDVLATNWGNLWRILADIPAYKQHLAGRVFPDLINEPSRWGCQWQTSCHEPNGTRACAPALQSYGVAAAAIWRADPNVPIFINGLGQDNSTAYSQCGNPYPGMHWGDGFITNKKVLQEYDVSDPSDIFTTAFTQKFGLVRIEQGEAQPSRLVLAPHIYPGTITGDVSALAASLAAITYRWDLSWGWKAQGLDQTSSGARIPALPVVLGEVGARDAGDSSRNNTDTTAYTPVDKMWLNIVASYLRALSERTGHRPSWFWWAWNANSGDTKGLVGPNTTWREVQWGKTRMLIRIMGLQPWYCAWWPEFCDTVNW